LFYAMSDEKVEVKGKGEPAIKAGGMRIAKAEHRDHGQAVQPVPKTAVTTGLASPAIALTTTQKEENKLAQHELFKDQEKHHDPPRAKREKKGPKQVDSIQIRQPNKLQ